jgi:hypothetical protein
MPKVSKVKEFHVILLDRRAKLYINPARGGTHFIALISDTP